MTYSSLEPFIPSGSDFEKSKQFFLELGFEIEWDGGEMAGFRNGPCRFILQQYDNKAFAENLMIAVKLPDVKSFWEAIKQKGLPERFGIPSVGEPVEQPYGLEVNVIDIAGVCWHFIQEPA